MTLMTNMTFTEHKAVEAPKRSHAHTQEIRRLPRCYSPY